MLTWPTHCKLKDDKHTHYSVLVHLSLRSAGPQRAAGFSPWGAIARVDSIKASAEVRRGRPAPEERTHERPLAWKAVRHAAVEPVAVVVRHHVDWLKKRCLGLWWNESQYGADLNNRKRRSLAYCITTLLLCHVSRNSSNNNKIQIKHFPD